MVWNGGRLSSRKYGQTARIARNAQLASRAGSADPMERALQVWPRGDRFWSVATTRTVLVHEYPLRPELLAFGNLWETADVRR